MEPNGGAWYCTETLITQYKIILAVSVGGKEEEKQMNQTSLGV